jgi:hypothetical protein
VRQDLKLAHWSALVVLDHVYYMVEGAMRDQRGKEKRQRGKAHAPQPFTSREQPYQSLGRLVRGPSTEHFYGL